MALSLLPRLGKSEFPLYCWATYVAANNKKLEMLPWKGSHVLSFVLLLLLLLLFTHTSHCQQHSHRKYLGLLVKCPNFLLFVTKFLFYRLIFNKVSNIKVHEYAPSASRADTRGQTKRQAWRNWQALFATLRTHLGVNDYQWRALNKLKRIYISSDVKLRGNSTLAV